MLLALLLFVVRQGQLTGGVIFSTHLLSHMALGFSVGYFIVDLGIMLSNSCLVSAAGGCTARCA